MRSSSLRAVGHTFRTRASVLVAAAAGLLFINNASASVHLDREDEGLLILRDDPNDAFLAPTFDIVDLSARQSNSSLTFSLKLSGGEDSPVRETFIRLFWRFVGSTSLRSMEVAILPDGSVRCPPSPPCTVDLRSGVITFDIPYLLMTEPGCSFGCAWLLEGPELDRFAVEVISFGTNLSICHDRMPDAPSGACDGRDGPTGGRYSLRPQTYDAGLRFSQGAWDYHHPRLTDMEALLENEGPTDAYLFLWTDPPIGRPGFLLTQDVSIRSGDSAGIHIDWTGEGLAPPAKLFVEARPCRYCPLDLTSSSVFEISGATRERTPIYVPFEAVVITATVAVVLCGFWWGVTRP